MKINLHEYAKELEYWIKAFEPLVDRASVSPLRDTLEELQASRDKTNDFRWTASRPIKFAIATEYDRAEGEATPVYITWMFGCRFSKDPKDKAKRPLWTLGELRTQIEVHRAEDDATILRFHHDLKNEGQLGPHAHLQISERFLEEKAGMRLAVPRFPAAALLPTDCLDLALSEFFPHRWPKSQSEAIGIGTLRDGQLNRATAFAGELHRQWKISTKKTPFAVLQNCFMPDIQLA